MDIAAFIRDQAARGHSRASVRETLGYSRERFAAALEYLGPITWAGQGASIGNRLAMEARRGVRTEAGLQALEKARAIRKEQHSHTVRDQRGTVAELCAYFKVPFNPQTVRRRLAGGLSIEAALFTPIQKPAPGTRRRRAMNN